MDDFSREEARKLSELIIKFHYELDVATEGWWNRIKDKYDVKILDVAFFEGMFLYFYQSILTFMHTTGRSISYEEYEEFIIGLLKSGSIHGENKKLIRDLYENSTMAKERKKGGLE